MIATSSLLQDFCELNRNDPIFVRLCHRLSFTDMRAHGVHKKDTFRIEDTIGTSPPAVVGPHHRFFGRPSILVCTDGHRLQNFVWDHLPVRDHHKRHLFCRPAAEHYGRGRLFSIACRNVKITRSPTKRFPHHLFRVLFGTSLTGGTQ